MRRTPLFPFFAALLLGCIQPALHAIVTNYPWPATAPVSDKYSVRVTQAGATTAITTLLSKPNFGKDPDENDDGVNGVLDDRTLSFAPFAFTGEIEIEVTKLYGSPAARVEISPKAYGIEPYFFNGATVRFRLSSADDRPEYVSVNFVASDNLDPDNSGGQNIKHGLMLFADSPPTDAPSSTAAGTVVYSPSVTHAQLATADVIYFPAGDHNLITRYPNNPFKGVLQISRHDQEIYLAPGAIVRGTFHGKGFDRIRLHGRGLLTADDLPWHGIRDENGDKTAFLNFMGSDDCTFEDFIVNRPAHHALPSSNRTTHRRIKLLGWSYNEDGIRPSGGSTSEEIFIKTEDDYDYARDPHTVKNSVFWPMRNGASGMLGWNNLGTGNTTYQNMYYIHSEWNTYKRNSGIIGSMLNQGVNLSGNAVENIYAETPTNMLANLTIQFDASSAWDPANPGLIENFTFRNILFETPFQTADGTTTRNPISGFTRNGATARVRNISFVNLVVGSTLVTAANAAQFFDIDPATTSNITFGTSGTLHTVTATAGTGGTISPSGTLPTPAGMTRALSILPHTGQRIRDVQIDGVSVGRRQLVTIPNIGANHTVTASFEAAANDYFDNSAASGAPTAPANLSVGQATSSSLTLTWTDLATNETAYVLQRAPAASGPWTDLPNAAANATSTVVTGLTAGTTYHFRIAASNGTGLSAYAGPASGTTLTSSPPPTSPPPTSGGGGGGGGSPSWIALALLATATLLRHHRR